MEAQDTSYRSLFEYDSNGKRFIDANVLLVGAGGIGCELLKNLVLTGFKAIHIVDLDTIDLSNLNRQFLFGHEHIKQSKAKVAKESAEKFNHKKVKITFSHANIKDSQFGLPFFKEFTMVFNALDNVDARRHVNKMIIAADVPMVDCGTTGFKGHTQVIKKGIFPCYDCAPKAAPKSFPVCTIRSTPSQPIHCIVWAKSYLFSEMFGVSEEDVPELDFTEDSDNAGEIKKLREEAMALQKIRESSRSDSFPRLIFDKVFKDDVERLLSMEDMWVSRKAPTPLSWDRMQEELVTSGIEGSQVAQKHQAAWTVIESFAVFADSARRLQQRMNAENRPEGETVLSFDKDDADAMDFVTASANLRSHIFNIDTKSKWDIKQMAGNIIPAIATTNAMFASLAILESYKVLRALRGLAPWTDAAVVYDNSANLDRAIVKQLAIDRINPNCHVCGASYQTILVNDPEATLGDIFSELKAHWDYDEDEMIVYKGNSEIIFDPDMPDLREARLANLGIAADCFIEIEDLSAVGKVNLVLYTVPLDAGHDPVPCRIKDPKSIPTKPPPPPPPPPPAAEDSLGKRKREDDEVDIGELKISKKAKAEDGVVAIEDDEDDGFIVVD